MAAPKVEPKIYTAVVLDFETGGLNCVDCACTQLAMQAVRLDNWVVLERYARYIAPYRKLDIGGAPKRKVLKTRQALVQEDAGISMKYEPVALTYSAITMDMLYNQGVDLKEVAQDVIEFGKRNTLSKGQQCKPILIGQNITFDIGFLQQLIAYAGLMPEFEKVFAGKVDFYGNFQPHYVDTIDLGRFAFAHLPDVTSYKLEILSERLGIELDDAHDAGADVTVTLNVAAVCSARLRQEGGGDICIQKKEKTRAHFKI